MGRLEWASTMEQCLRFIEKAYYSISIVYYWLHSEARYSSDHEAGPSSSKVKISA
jgi:hypothetical protein